MNFPKFNIIIVCTGYARQLKICLHYWSQMKYCNYEIFIITYIKDIATINVCEQNKNVNFILYDGEKFHHKGQLIDYGLSMIKNKGRLYHTIRCRYDIQPFYFIKNRKFSRRTR